MNRTEEINKSQAVLADVIEEAVVKPLRAGKCGINKGEIYAAVRLMCHQEQTISDVCHLTGWSARTLERRWREGDFPAPHKTPSNKPVWWLDEVEIWIADNAHK